MSAKIGLGIEEVLEAIVRRVPAPKDRLSAPLRALIYDSYYDAYRGIVCQFRVVDGRVRRKGVCVDGRVRGGGKGGLAGVRAGTRGRAGRGACGGRGGGWQGARRGAGRGARGARGGVGGWQGARRAGERGRAGLRGSVALLHVLACAAVRAACD